MKYGKHAGHFRPESPKKQSTGALIARLAKAGFEIDPAIVKAGLASKLANAAKASLAGRGINMHTFSDQLGSQGLELHKTTEGYRITLNPEATVDYVRTLSSI